MAMGGRGPSQITTQLTKDNVLTPTAYKQRMGKKTPNSVLENPTRWYESTVVKILERREYTGCVVNFKTYTNAIWDQTKQQNPMEKQAVFYGIHEPIIDIDVFDKVQQIRQQRHRRTKAGKTSLFSGLVYCTDCGKLSDDRYSMMSQTYEAKQEQLVELVRQLEQNIEVQERQNENIEQFIRKIHKYEDLTGLTPRSLRDLVSGIYVSAPDKSTGKRRQSIQIKYDGIGFIPLDELMERETA